MNLLTQTCLSVSRAGYEGHKHIDPIVHLDRLQTLAVFLLNKPVVISPKKKISDTKKVAICFGAGIDSYCALVSALREKRQITLVYVNYGQPYFAAEFRVFDLVRKYAFKKQSKSAIVKDLSRFEHNMKLVTSAVSIIKPEEKNGLDWENYIIPARNLVLAAEASPYAQTVWIVATHRPNEETGARDKTSMFFSGTSVLFSEFYGYHVAVESPFFHKSKWQVVQEYLAEGGSIEALSETFSCYSPVWNNSKQRMEHCSKCLACFKRWKLFKQLSVDTTPLFAGDPAKAPNYEKYQAHEEAKGRE